jgi:hypothetical protein
MYPISAIKKKSNGYGKRPLSMHFRNEDEYLAEN